MAGQASLIGPRKVESTALAFRGPGTTTETTGAASSAGMVKVYAWVGTSSIARSSRHGLAGRGTPHPGGRP